MICFNRNSLEKEHLDWFVNEILVCTRVGFIVGTVLSLIVFTPHNAGVFPGASFLMVVLAYSLGNGGTLGQAINGFQSTLFGMLVSVVEATISTAICVDKWVQIPFIILFTFINLHFMEIKSNPGSKSLTTGISIVFIVVFGNMRLSNSVADSIVTLWWTMVYPLLAGAVAIAFHFFPIPGISTLLLDKNMHLLQDQVVKLLEILFITLEVAPDRDQENEYRTCLRSFKIELDRYERILVKTDQILNNSIWELVFFFISKVAVRSKPRLALCKILGGHLRGSYRILSRELLKNEGIRLDPQSKIFLTRLIPANKILLMLAKGVFDGTVDLSECERSFEDQVTFARIEILKHDSLKVSDHRTFGFLYSLQMRNRFILKTLLGHNEPEVTYMENAKALWAIRKTHFYATPSQLKSTERIIESLKFALTAGVAQALVYAFPEVFLYGQIDKPFYMAMTVGLIASVQNSGSSIQKSVYRVVGSAIGGIYTIFVFLVGTQQVINAGIFPTVMFSTWPVVATLLQRSAGSQSYAYFVMGITPLIISMDGVVYFTTKNQAVNTLVVRLLDTGVAAALVIFACLVWSYSATEKLHRNVSELMTSDRESLRKVFENTQPVDFSKGSSALNCVKGLVGPCNSEPALWHLPFASEPFSELLSLMQQAHNCLAIVDTALQQMREQESHPLYDSIRETASELEKPIDELLAAIALAFSQISSTPQISSIQSLSSVLADKMSFIETRLSKQLQELLIYMVNLFQDPADNISLHDSKLPAIEDPSHFTIKSIGLQAFLYHYSLYCRYVIDLSIAAETYLIEICALSPGTVCQIKSEKMLVESS